MQHRHREQEQQRLVLGLTDRLGRRGQDSVDE